MRDAQLEVVLWNFFFKCVRAASPVELHTNSRAGKLSISPLGTEEA